MTFITVESSFVNNFDKFIQSFTYSFVRLFIYSFNQPPTVNNLFIQSFIPSFIHLIITFP